MRRAQGGPQRWMALGRLLPREIRERVFEPALSDLIYRWATVPVVERRMPFVLQALGTYFGCVPVVIPRIFVQDGRLTRFGHVVLWGSTALVAFVLLVSTLARRYGGY